MRFFDKTKRQYMKIQN